MLDLSLSIEEVIYAILLSFFITWFILGAMKLRQVIKRASSQFGYPAKDLSQILQRCYALFPKEMIQFHGKIYKRGMKVQIITIQQKIFEGELIGSNNKDMVCILTNKYIIAHEISNILEINVIDGLDKLV